MSTLAIFLKRFSLGDSQFRVAVNEQFKEIRPTATVRDTTPDGPCSLLIWVGRVVQSSAPHDSPFHNRVTAI